MELRFPLILDGATGTELQKRGYTGDVCAEQWTLDHPDAIIDIQRGKGQPLLRQQYLHAGGHRCLGQLQCPDISGGEIHPVGQVEDAAAVFVTGQIAAERLRRVFRR